MPRYANNYEWTCPRCGAYNSEGYQCGKCFYDPKTPKQRLSWIAVALAVGCVLLVVVGAWFIWARLPLGAVMVVLGALMGWGASRW